MYTYNDYVYLCVFVLMRKILYVANVFIPMVLFKYLRGISKKIVLNILRFVWMLFRYLKRGYQQKTVLNIFRLV